MPADDSTGHAPPPELIAAVARIESGVDTIQTKLLPPVAQDAKEAKEGVIKLTGWNRDIVRRVDGLEDADGKHETKAEAQGAALSAQERELAGLSKWRWWLMGIAVSFGLFAAGMAAKALFEQGEAHATGTGLRRDVDRHEGEIDALERVRKADRDALIREVRAVPTKVQEVLPEPDLDDAVEDAAELTDYERRAIRQILKRAADRNGKAGKSP